LLNKGNCKEHCDIGRGPCAKYPVDLQDSCSTATISASRVRGLSRPTCEREFSRGERAESDDAAKKKRRKAVDWLADQQFYLGALKSFLPVDGPKTVARGKILWHTSTG